MKVLHITTSSKGGAGIAALRLHKALQSKNVKSAYLSNNLTINFDNEIMNDSFFEYKKISLFKRIFNKLRMLIYPSDHQNKIKEWNKSKLDLQFIIATFPYSNYRTHKHPLVIEADIINLHWIGGIIDYNSFFVHCKKPIVWTLHDKNPIQGMFHYKKDEIFNNKYIKKLINEITEVKRISTNKIKKGTIVSPSYSLLKEVKSSNFFSHLKTVQISNSINLDVFKVLDKVVLRDKYQIDNNEFVILFIANDINNKWKGFGLLLEAIKLVNNMSLTIVTIGKGTVEGLNNTKVIEFGEISSSEKLVEIYGLSDVLVLPTLEDNLPNVMLESFACGIPMISFPVGGMIDHLITDYTGYLANEISARSLSTAIYHFYNTKHNYDKFKIRNYAEDNFNFTKQAIEYLDVYNDNLI